MTDMSPKVAVLMESKADWDTLHLVSETLTKLDIPHECRAFSANRAPDTLVKYIGEAEGRGVQVIIAGAGGAAHLASLIAAKTALPVLGVPMPSKSLGGLDSLLSIVQMPKGMPVGTLAIGNAGAINAALFAGAILALGDTSLNQRLREYRENQTQTVLADQVLGDS